MFHALRFQKVAAPGLVFTHHRADTAALNRLVLPRGDRDGGGDGDVGGADVVAISAGAYPACADRYQLLPHGASVGRGYGPVVVAPRPLAPADLAGLRVGIPGRTTTAWMVLQMITAGIRPVEIPIAPFGRIFEAVAAGEVDAALLIHEGRMVYRERGLHLVVDLGAWWQQRFGLPLPLGVNVIRRALGPARVAEVSSVLRQSIRWASEHKAELVAALAAEGKHRGDPALADPALVDHYLDLYANQDTLEMPEDARRGITVLYERAAAAGLIPHAGAGAVSRSASGWTVDWAP